MLAQLNYMPSNPLISSVVSELTVIYFSVKHVYVSSFMN